MDTEQNNTDETTDSGASTLGSAVDSAINPETAPEHKADDSAEVAQEPPVEEDKKTGKTGNPVTTLDEALKVIADLRKENARQRTAAKERTATETRVEIARTLAEALGVPHNEGEDGDKGSEVEDIQALTAQVEDITRAETQARRELAVYRAAHDVDADPDMLLDSRSFLSHVSDIDPDNHDDIVEAVKDAVKNNPAFRAPRAGGVTRADHAPGGQESTTPLNVSDAVASYYR